MNRRGFFGVATGGALAAPELVNSVAAQADSAPRAVDYAMGETLGGKRIAHEEWTLDMLAKAKRIASGDIRDEDMSDRISRYSDNYDALKSVSSQGRDMMRMQREERRWRENIIRRAKEELERYDRFGIIHRFL